MEPPHAKRFTLLHARRKFRELRREKAGLEERVKDLEHSLEIIQTAQAWSLGSGSIRHEQAQKIKEVTSLLLQAKKARQDAINFSKIGKGALFEKLRTQKNMLLKERQEKREMRERLVGGESECVLLCVWYGWTNRTSTSSSIVNPVH